MYKNVLLIIILLSYSLVFGQQNFDYSTELLELEFKLELGAGQLPIYKDNNTIRYEAPHFVSSSQQSKPVAYLSGSLPEVKVTFISDCSSFYIRGRNDFTDFEMTSEDPIMPDINGVAIVNLVASTPFDEGEIRLFENFKIDFEFSVDNISWETIGESDNTIYVIGGSSFLGSTNPYHTIYDLSCRAADGMMAVTPEDEKNVILRIFDTYFKKDDFGQFPEIRSVVTGNLLQYYGVDPLTVEEYTCSIDLQGLFSTGDGRCGAWATFLEEVIAIQRMNVFGDEGFIPFIIPTNDFAQVNSNGGVNLSEASMDKLEDDFNGFFDGEESFDPLVNLLPFPEYFFLVKNWEDISEGEGAFIELYEGGDDPIDLARAQSAPGALGIPGAGNVSDPRSIFPNHTLVFYPGMLLDPSYGIRYVNEDWVESSMVDMNVYDNDNMDTARGTLLKREVTPGVFKYYYWIEELIDFNMADFILF